MASRDGGRAASLSGARLPPLDQRRYCRTRQDKRIPVDVNQDVHVALSLQLCRKTAKPESCRLYNSSFPAAFAWKEMQALLLPFVCRAQQKHS